MLSLHDSKKIVAPKTNFRWVIIILFFSLNMISYIDRSAISYAVKDIMADFNFSYAKMGTILGAFGIGYLITTFGGGIIVDRYGSRITILLSALVWAVAIGCTGLATGFFMLYLARFGLGLGEGPNFPAVARTVSDWVPPTSRARALSNTLFAVPLAIAVGGPLVSFLLIMTNWHWMFIILAVMLLIWWPFWWFFYRNKPSESRFVNRAELNYIRPEPLPVAETKEPWQKTWRFFFTSPTILSNNWAFFVYGYSMFFFLTWLPDYLEKVYGLNVAQVGLFSFLPWSLAALFLWGGGFISDAILNKTKKLRYARSYPILIAQILSFLSLIPVLFWHNLIASLIGISLAIAFSLSNNTCLYAINVDVAKERAGSSLGLMNAWFAFAGFLAPSLTGWLVQTTGNFNAAFVLIVVLILSSIIGLYFFHHPDQEKLVSIP